MRGGGMRPWVSGFLNRSFGGAAVLIFSGLALARCDARIPAEEEAAGHWLVAQALAEGEGYRDLARPDRPPVGDPFGLHALVLAPLAASGAGPGVGRAASIVFAAIALWLFWAFARRRLGAEAAAGVALALAFSPLYGAAAVALRSDALLLLWLALTLYAAARSDERGVWFAVALGSAALAFATDLRGTALLPALAVAALVRGRWPRFAWAAGTFAALSAASLVWSCAIAGGAQGVCASWLRVDPRTPEWGVVGPAELLRRVATHSVHYAADVLPSALVGPASGVGAIVASLVASIFAALVFVGWVRGIRAAHVPELALALLAILALVAPSDEAELGMLVPILPLAFVACVEGGRAGLRFVPRPMPRAADLAWGAALAVVALPHTVTQIVQQQQCTRSVRAGDAYACYREEWRGFFEVAEWARAQTPPEAIVVSEHPRLFHWVSGRSAVSSLGMGNHGDLWAFVDSTGARYLLLEPVSRLGPERFLTAIRADPTRVEVAHRAGSPPTTLLRVRERPAGPRGRGRG